MTERYVLMVRWGTEWPAATGPFDSKDDAEAEWRSLLRSGECSTDTHESIISTLYEPSH